MTDLLLDTHAFLWWMADDDELSDSARDAIAAPANRVFISAASTWEIEVKRARRALTAPTDLAAAIAAASFEELAITVAHTEAVGALPHHHGDPFDRILVAQCQVEGLTLVTRDRDLAAYGVSLLPASG